MIKYKIYTHKKINDTWSQMPFVKINNLHRFVKMVLDHYSHQLSIYFHYEHPSSNQKVHH